MPVITQLKELFSSWTDVLNLGRLIFYPFAGAVIVIPLSMLYRLLVDPSPELEFWSQLSRNSTHLTQPSGAELALLFIGSIVAGFLVAIVGYAMVISPIGSEAMEDIKKQQRDPIEEYSIAYYYPWLSDVEPKQKDYLSWLISEYYRFVEIATFIPLSMIIGLGIVETYVFSFLCIDFARPGIAGFTAAHRAFLGLLVLSAFIWFYAWPQVWAPRVIKPVIRSYLVAKRELIQGICVNGGALQSDT